MVTGLIVGFILAWALMFFIGSVLDWREKRAERNGWCERRSRATYRPLPPPDMTEKAAKRFLDHVRFADSDWPGQRNGALHGYLTGEHDAARMESKLDRRFFGGTGYRRGELIEEYELGNRRAAERRRNPPPTKKQAAQMRGEDVPDAWKQ
jgi:hypothetical protein